VSAGLPYRDVARRHGVSKDAVKRHRDHIPRRGATALATAANVIALLIAAEAAPNWNVSIFTIREARRGLEELVTVLNVR
jgi:hypothetical protein